MSTLEERAKIKNILHRATYRLCEHLCLKSTSITKYLKSEGALNDGDVEEINSHARHGDKIDAMLVILKRKPVTAYCSFMNALWDLEGCQDLFTYMEKLERDFGFTGRPPPPGASPGPPPGAYPPTNVPVFEAGACPRERLLSPKEDSKVEDLTESVQAVSLSPTCGKEESVKLISSSPHLSDQETSNNQQCLAGAIPVTTSVQATDEAAPPHYSIAPLITHVPPVGASNTSRLEATTHMPIAESQGIQHGACYQDDPIKPDGNGSYMAISVKSAPPPSRDHKNADKSYVSMLSLRKGFAYILNVGNFDQVSRLKTRQGSEIDMDNMVHLFTQLGYTICAQTDLDSETISGSLEAFVSKFTADDASSVVVLMSHGGTSPRGDGFIYGKDGKKVLLTNIVELFKPNRCPNLRNKPKMFFIQACRGSGKRGSGASQFDTDGSTEPDAPESLLNLEAALEVDSDAVGCGGTSNSDVHISFSTIEGFLSLRDRTAGTWFVQALMEVFLANAHKDSLSDMMLQVTNRVTSMEGNFFDNETNENRKVRQTPQTKSTLRKQVYFHPDP